MTTNKILPVALVAALLGGTVGAFVMRPSNNSPEVAKATDAPARNSLVAGETAANPAEGQKNLLENELADETKNMSDEERAAFRDGFLEGVEAARSSNLTTAGAVAAAPTASRVAYRAPARTRTRTVSRNSAPRRVYYDYGERRGRSFWQKHRDKLTVAMGAGGGAIVGGLIGGKKGAAIGALAGGGGSALYTYKLRKRNRNY